ncbi:MAG: hypothetical protein WCT26_05175 [Candidatus Buchananbacteria bacterium]|jgi:hypothetical protein
MTGTRLKEIWINSENYKRAEIFNCGCPPKVGKSFDNDLFEKVMLKLKKTTAK